MNIGAEGEPGIIVTQHGGYRLYIYAVLKGCDGGCGGEGVPQVVEADMLTVCSLQDGGKFFCAAVGFFGAFSFTGLR